MSIGSGVLTPHKAINKEQCNTKAPSPTNGTDTLVSAKSVCGTEVPRPNGVGNNGGAKVPRPNGTDTLVSANNVCAR
jgi:hypothetical protein